MQDIYKKIISKPTVDEIYYNFFTRYISAYITRVIFKSSLTPNLISYIMLICGIGAVYLLSFNNLKSLLFSGILFVSHNVLDTVDGDLARARKQTSLFGKFIDQITHSIVNPSIFFALYFRFYEIFNYSNLFILCGFIFLIDMYLKKNFEVLTNYKYSFSISKNNKSSSKLLKFKPIKIINDIFFSIIGFYHIIILIFIFDFIYAKNFMLNYSILFSLILLFKFALRIIIMSKILSNKKN